jgi:hypothetical protein
MLVYTTSDNEIDFQVRDPDTGGEIEPGLGAHDPRAFEFGGESREDHFRLLLTGDVLSFRARLLELEGWLGRASARWPHGEVIGDID